jgi:hypothetical protein
VSIEISLIWVSSMLAEGPSDQFTLGIFRNIRRQNHQTFKSDMKSILPVGVLTHRILRTRNSSDFEGLARSRSSSSRIFEANLFSLGRFWVAFPTAALNL